ncbi:hypothetical protein KMS41_16750 [Ochrobactrum sp. BTU1]|nr:hypothetical protein KMS41_16750 [Ochrobactrum sp. BTU1]
MEVIRQHAAESATDDEGDIYVIGPHEGKELQLMLRGEKGLARFCTTENLTPEQVGDLGFEPYVKDGTFKMHVSRSQSGPLIETRYYYLPQEEWRLKLDLLVAELMHTSVMSNFTPEDLLRLDGWLLGYSGEDIEDFICQWNARKSAKDPTLAKKPPGGGSNRDSSPP